MRDNTFDTQNLAPTTLPFSKDWNGALKRTSQSASSQRETRFVIIEGQRLWQECLAHSIGQLNPGVKLVGCDSVESYLDGNLFELSPDAIILRFTQNEMLETKTQASIRRLVKEAAPIPVVVLSDCENIDQMAAVLDCGVNGYIPASIGLRAIGDAIKTAASGGFLMTGQELKKLSQTIAKKTPVDEPCSELLTLRQSAVAEALRQGKPNKVIAFELGMCENTVKVHVRNILKKLEVINRTEAAFKLNKAHAVH